MKSSTLRKASLSATDFQLSHIPCKNKALADENADLRAKVAQLLDEKEKWQIKYGNLNMKISDFSNYRRDVKHLLQKMSFYLQNFLVVRDMLVRMLQQEADYEEMKDHNTTSKQKAEPEQVLTDQNNGEEQQQKQQQQQHVPQNQSQNTTVNPVLQSSSVHYQMQKCVSENDEEHHPKDKTRYQLKEIEQYDQLKDFGYCSQQNKVWTVTEEKPLCDVEQGEMVMNEAMQKSRLSNEIQDHRGVCMSMSSGNDSLKHCTGFQSKFGRNGQHEQLLKQNEENVSSRHLQERCSLECECLISDSQHACVHLPQVSHKNLKWNIPQGQLLKLQQAAPLNCYPSRQSLIKGQQESVPDQFDQENNCRMRKQRKIFIKEMEQQVLEEQKLEDQDHQSLESHSKTQHCKGVHQMNADLQGKPQTEHELLNTFIQSQKPSMAQRPSHSDVQGQITTDKGGQSEQVTLNQRIKLMAGKGEKLRNKDIQFVQDVDHPLTSDQKQQIPTENIEQVNIHKALQTVEEEEDEEEEKKKKSLKSGEYLASANDKLLSMGRDQGHTGNQETSVRIRQQLPVKFSQLLPATLRATLSLREDQTLYRDKGELQSSESKRQLSPKDKETPVVQRQKHTECEKQNVVTELSKKQGEEHNIEKQYFTSVKVQQQTNCPPSSAYTEGAQQPTVEQSQHLATVPDKHFPHYQLNGEPVQQSAMEKEQSHYTEKRDYLTIKRDQRFTADQEHKSRNSKEHGRTNNQELCSTTDHQHQFVTAQQQCPLSDKLQSTVGNKSQKLTDRLINIVASDNEMKLKTKNAKQFGKDKGLVPDTEQTRQFPGEHVQKIIKKTPKLVPGNDKTLSPEQPIVKQGQQQKMISQDQQLKGEQGHQPKQAQQSTVTEVKGLTASCCLSEPEGNKQPTVLAERDQQQFIKSTLEISTELNQEIVVQKLQDTRTKEVKWLPSEQYQWEVTKKQWKLIGLPRQLTPPHSEKELQEHSSLFLLSELSKAGFETSFNSSTHSNLCLSKKIQQTSTLNTTAFETSCNTTTQSILLCAKKMQLKSTLNNTELHRSYMEESIIKRVPVITEAPIYGTLENYKARML